MNDPQNLSGKSILAIFAHPDDELFVAPVLSRYTREGVDCHLAIVTDGRFGLAPHMNGLAGDDLVNLRREELIKAAEALSINPPILLNFTDGFAHKTPELTAALSDISKLYSEVVKLIREFRPSVLLTFGPDGIYGHPDHTTVGNVVTTAFQAMAADYQTQLFYPGICIQDFPDLFNDDSDKVDRMRYGLDDKQLPVRIEFDEEDSKAAHRSLSCHQSQFTQSRIDSMAALFYRHRQVRFRAWNGGHPSESSLFF